MIQAVFTIGIVMTVVLVVLAFVLSKMNLKGFTMYYPFAAVFFVGLVFLLLAIILEKVDILGAGFGGWGLACLFSAAIAMIIAAILDSYAQKA